MSLDKPPVPTRRRQEFKFPSQVYPDLTYVLRAYDQSNVPTTLINQRMIAAKRRPLTEKMRAMLLETDLSPFFSPAEISRAYETIHALQAGAMGIPDDDIAYIDQEIEPLMIQHFPAYRALALQDEKFSYERRMRDLADLLCAVEEKGEHYTFPADDPEAKYEYVRDHVDPMDISLLYVQSRNLARMAPDTAKNSEAPSTSG